MMFHKSPLFPSKIGAEVWISVIVAKLLWNPLQPQDSALVGWGGNSDLLPHLGTYSGDL